MIEARARISRSTPGRTPSTAAPFAEGAHRSDRLPGGLAVPGAEVLDDVPLVFEALPAMSCRRRTDRRTVWAGRAVRRQQTVSVPAAEPGHDTVLADRDPPAGPEVHEEIRSCRADAHNPLGSEGEA